MGADQKKKCKDKKKLKDDAGVIAASDTATMTTTAPSTAEVNVDGAKLVGKTIKKEKKSKPEKGPKGINDKTETGDVAEANQAPESVAKSDDVKENDKKGKKKDRPPKKTKKDS